MGRSLDLRVVFGIKVERSENPWYDEDEGDGDHDAWWQDSGGFKPTFYPYNDRGEYAEGVTKDDPRVQAYYDEMRAWQRANPCPFEIEYNGDYDSEEIFVCAPNRNRYYETTELSRVLDEAKIDEQTEKAFREFLRQHYGDAEPKWWLIPFYG